MTSWTKKDTKFVWGKKCEESFDTLKECLTITPILSLPNGNEGFVIYTEASSQDYAGLLMQNRKVKSYASRQLKEVEKTYPAHDIEL